jgi:multicomponent K+:H+ antiporter subunit E
MAMLGIWVLLQEHVSIGVVVIGLVLARGMAILGRKLEPPGAMLRRPIAAFCLAVIVLGDVLRSNAAVAAIILRIRSREYASGFVRIPLDLRAPYGLTTLACIITATPGTIWVAYDSASNSVLLHVLDLVDETVWLSTIKERYEKRLLEIFE